MSYIGSLSKVKMDSGSPICERVRKKIVEYFKNNVPQHLQCIISSKDSEKLEKSLCVRDKGQGRRPLLDARDLLALRPHCITHRHDSVIDITKWAPEYFRKPLSVNSIHCAIYRCQLKLYHAKRSHRVLWAKAHLKWTVSKWKSVLWSDESKLDILVGNRRCRVPRATEEGDLPVCSAFSSKASISDGMEVHMCIRYVQLACFRRHYECWKGFRATYAPLQMTSILGKA